MRLSNSLRKVLARAPVFLVLALIFIVGHPTRAQAENPVLKQDMTGFVSVKSYNVIQTNGKNLNRMFGCNLPKGKQYLAYFTVDKKRTSDWYWFTYQEYWHTYPLNNAVPESNVSRKGVFNVVNVKNPGKDNNSGKFTFTGSYQTSIGGSTLWVPSGGTGTLHYFCTDPGTPTGEKFLEFLDKNDGTVTFYISPVIRSSKGATFYSLASWKSNEGYGWGDTSTFADHYNVPFTFKASSVKVINTASLIDRRLGESTSMQVQTRLKYGSDSKWVRDVDNDKDYIFRPKFIKQADGSKKQAALNVTDSSGKKKENPVVTYEKYSTQTKKAAEPYKLKSPVVTKGEYILTFNHNGEEKNAVLVGFTVYKKVKLKNGETKKIFLSNCMIEMKETMAGYYTPYFVDDKKDKDIEEDVDKDGETTAKPQNMLNRKVTVMSYRKYSKSGEERKTYKKGDEVKFKDWIRDLNATALSTVSYWINDKAHGVRYEENDCTTELYVDWLYAKIPGGGDPPESRVTLEQYYTYENTQIETPEYTDKVPTSDELSYKHEKGTEAKSERKTSKFLDKVNYGEPWVSYSVEQNEKGAYKLKNGKYLPEDDDDGTSAAKSSTKTKFKNTKPDCGFTNDDLVLKDSWQDSEGVEHSKSVIPYVLKLSKKAGESDDAVTLNNYLYKVRIKTEYDSQWTEFTVQDIWGDCDLACGTLSNKDRSYTTNAPYMRRFIKATDVTGIPQFQLRNLVYDWSQDAYNMTHFIIPEVRGDVTIQAYYTSTVPIRIYVYSRENYNDSYTLDNSQTQMIWCSAGTTYTGNYSGGYAVSGIFAANLLCILCMFAAGISQAICIPSIYLKKSVFHQYSPDRQAPEISHGTPDTSRRNHSHPDTGTFHEYSFLFLLLLIL